MEICINASEDYKVIFKGMDLFRTKVEEIFDSLKSLSEYDCDCEYEYLSTTYYFKEWGLRLWRESAFYPKLLKRKYFMELILEQEENLKYEKKFWFLNQVCVSNPEIINELL